MPIAVHSCGLEVAQHSHQACPQSAPAATAGGSLGAAAAAGPPVPRLHCDPLRADLQGQKILLARVWWHAARKQHVSRQPISAQGGSSVYTREFVLGNFVGNRPARKV